MGANKTNYIVIGQHTSPLGEAKALPTGAIQQAAGAYQFFNTDIVSHTEKSGKQNSVKRIVFNTCTPFSLLYS